MVSATFEDSGFALVDEDGDGRRLKAETWLFVDDDGWIQLESADTGPLDLTAPRVEGGGILLGVFYVHGVAPGYAALAVDYGGTRHEIPVVPPGVWAFMTWYEGLDPRELHWELLT